MTAGIVRPLESKSVGMQVLVLALVFDPIGAALGYALHPQFGVDPIAGVAVGLMVAGVVPMLWVLRNAAEA